MKYQDIIARLKNDEDYYGEFGQQYLSNSNIKTLLKDPASFGNPVETTTAMLHGRYFHTLILEPEKIDDFQIIEASTRNTNIYKEASGGVLTMLKHEADMLKSAADAMMSNYSFYELIRDASAVYEVPGIKDIFGYEWKGKADILLTNLAPDIKTTTDIDKFKKSAYIYNYDSQSYIYEQIFGVPVVFLVVEKETNRLGMFHCSEEFKLRGKQKVMRAVEIYDRFFSENASDSIENYYIDDIL